MLTLRTPRPASTFSADPLGPRFGAEERVAETDLVGRDASLCERLRKRQRVARRAGDHVRPEILDQHQLPLGHAAGDRDDGHPQPLAPGVKAEPAREQAVAVRVVQHHPGLCSGQRKGARVYPGEQVEVGGGVADHGQLPRRPGRGVHARELLARDGEHPERVRVAQVVLAREGELLHVVDRNDVARLEIAQALLVERDPLLDVIDQRP